MTKVFKIVVIAILVTQTSASFFDTMRGAFQPLETSVSKLFSDVVTDLRTTIDCTILAVEHVFSWQAMFGKSIDYYDERCSGLKNKLPPALNDTYVESAKDILVQETNVKDLDETINKSVPNTQERLIIEDAFLNETLRLQKIHKIICEELEKLTAGVKMRNNNLDHDASSAETVLSEVRQLYEIEQHDKTSSRANEVRQTFDKVLKLLQVNDTGGVYSDDDEVKVIMKGIGKSLGTAIDDVEVRFMEWKQDGINKTKTNQNSIQNGKTKPNKDGYKFKRESNLFEAMRPQTTSSNATAESSVNSEEKPYHVNLAVATNQGNTDKVSNESPDIFVNQRNYQIQNTYMIKDATVVLPENIQNGAKQNSLLPNINQSQFAAGVLPSSLISESESNEDTQLTLRSLIRKDFDYPEYTYESLPLNKPDSESIRKSFQVQNGYLGVLDPTKQGTGLTTPKNSQNQENNAPEYKQFILEGVQFRKAADVLLPTQDSTIHNVPETEILHQTGPENPQSNEMMKNEVIRESTGITAQTKPNIQTLSIPSIAQLTKYSAPSTSSNAPPTQKSSKTSNTCDTASTFVTQPIEESHQVSSTSDIVEPIQKSTQFSSSSNISQPTKGIEKTPSTSGAQPSTESSQVSGTFTIARSTQESNKSPITSGTAHSTEEISQTPTAFQAQSAKESRHATDTSNFAQSMQKRKEIPNSSVAQPTKENTQASSTPSIVQKIQESKEKLGDSGIVTLITGSSAITQPIQEIIQTPNIYNETKLTQESDQVSSESNAQPTQERSLTRNFDSSKTQEFSQAPINSDSQVNQQISQAPITTDSHLTQESSQISSTSDASPTQESSSTFDAQPTQEISQISSSFDAPLTQEIIQVPSTTDGQLIPESSLIPSTYKAQVTQESSPTPSTFDAQQTQESAQVPSQSGAQLTQDSSQITNISDAQPTQESGQASSNSNLQLTHTSSPISSSFDTQQTEEISDISSTSDTSSIQEISQAPSATNSQLTQESSQVSSTLKAQPDQERSQALRKSNAPLTEHSSQISNEFNTQLTKKISQAPSTFDSQLSQESSKISSNTDPQPTQGSSPVSSTSDALQTQEISQASSNHNDAESSRESSQVSSTSGVQSSSQEKRQVSSTSDTRQRSQESNQAQISYYNIEEGVTTFPTLPENQYVPSPKFKPVLNNNEQAIESSFEKASVDSYPTYSSDFQYVPSPKFNAARDKNTANDPLLEPSLTTSATSGIFPEISDDTFTNNEDLYLPSFIDQSDLASSFISSIGNQEYPNNDNIFTTQRSDSKSQVSQAMLEAQAIINDSQFSESLMDNLFGKLNHQHNLFEEPDMLYH